MGGRKIPDDAFEYYLSLGPGRSYRAVAENYGVSKRAVTSLAKREAWQNRLSEPRESRRRRCAARASCREAIDLVLRKGVEGLEQLCFESAADASQAIVWAVREMRRLEFGKPNT